MIAHTDSLPAQAIVAFDGRPHSGGDSIGHIRSIDFAKRAEERGRLMRTTKTITVPLSVWYREEDGHFRLRFGRFITTVNDTPGSARYHGNLYKKLGRLMEDAGKPTP